MTLITGTLTNAATTLEKWDVATYRASDGVLLSRQVVTTPNESPVPYQLACGNEISPCIVMASPSIDRIWSPSNGTQVADAIAPTSLAVPYLFIATIAPTIVADPYWADVVLKMSLNGSFADLKGHMVGYTPPGGSSDSATEPSFYTGGGPTDSASQPLGAKWLNLGTYLPYYSSYISASSSDFNVGTGDFTLDFWLFTAGGSLSPGWVVTLGNPTTDGFGVAWNPTDGIQVWANSSLQIYIAHSTDAWVYVAVERVAGVLKLYIDGALAGTAAYTGFIGGDFAAGCQFGGSGAFFTAGLFDLRLTNGVARYAADFAKPETITLSTRPSQTGSSEPTWPETAGLTVVDNEVTWLCQGRAARPACEEWLFPTRSTLASDSHAANVALAVTFDSDVLDILDHPRFYKAPYSALATDSKPLDAGYGAWFFGNASTGPSWDWVGVSYKTIGTDLDIGTGDFTLDFWFNFLNTGPNVGGSMSLFEVGESYYSQGIRVEYIGDTGTLNVVVDGGTLLTGTIAVSGTSTGWQYIEVSRSSGALQLFVNGASVDTTSCTNDFVAYNTRAYAATVFLGGDVATWNYPYYGYMADCRLTIGVARNTDDYTVPTARISG